MEIGGCDWVIPTEDPVSLIEKIKELVNWPNAIIEMADDPEYKLDFFWYKDQISKDIWDTGEVCPEDDMIYFLLRDGYLTVVTDLHLMEKIKLEMRDVPKVS